jgi:hypothetical protein
MGGEFRAKLLFGGGGIAVLQCGEGGLEVGARRRSETCGGTGAQ